MTIVITLGLHTGCIENRGIFTTGIVGNFYTERGEFLTFKTGIPGGLRWRQVTDPKGHCRKSHWSVEFGPVGVRVGVSDLSDQCPFGPMKGKIIVRVIK